MQLPRSYTVTEIDALRNLCERKFLFGSYQLPKMGGASRSYNEIEKYTAVEEMVRTHMFAGHTAEDLSPAPAAEKQVLAVGVLPGFISALGLTTESEDRIYDMTFTDRNGWTSRLRVRPILNNGLEIILERTGGGDYMALTECEARRLVQALQCYGLWNTLEHPSAPDA